MLPCWENRPSSTPLDEQSARRRVLYVHNKHNKRQSKSQAWYEQLIPAIKRPQIKALNRKATGIDSLLRSDQNTGRYIRLIILRFLPRKEVVKSKNFKPLGSSVIYVRIIERRRKKIWNFGNFNFPLNNPKYLNLLENFQGSEIWLLHFYLQIF